jgi:YidC/Oxa1 family membrane protein insertase
VIAAAWFQALLDAIGTALAALYRLVPNYGASIILFTIAIRVVLLPLGIKQVRSMQAMQTIQPEIKRLQKQYKGDRQRFQEEQMKLFKEHGVNPLGGCLPIFAQFPVLIALFAVLQFPKGLTHIPHSDPNPIVAEPQDSRLYVDIVNQRTHVFGMNLVCSASQGGSQVTVDKNKFHIPDAPNTLDCGKGAANKIPYFLLLAGMIATTFYQQKQMQRASPGPVNQQQKILSNVMPVFFGFIGLQFPAGLVLYWTTTNLVQIGQQHFMLSRGLMGAKTPAGDGDDDRPSSKPVDRGPRKDPGPRRGQRGADRRRPPAQGDRRGRPGAQASKGGGDGRAGKPRTPGPRPASQSGDGGSTTPKGGPGGKDGGSRKKRRKR